MKKNSLLLLLCLLSLVVSAQLFHPGGGVGSYALTFPIGPYPIKNPDPVLNEVHHYQIPCVNRWFEKAHPKVVTGFTKPIATNEWWSAQIWDFETNRLSQPSDVTAYGSLMYFQPGWKIGPFGMASHPHPLSLKGRAYGLDISHHNTFFTTPDAKTVGFNNIMNLNIGINGMLVPDNIGTKVVDYGDWTVKVLWDDQAGNSLEATTGHGLPFVYCKKTGGDVNMRYNGTLTAWSSGPQSLGITINDGTGTKHYGVFFPSGTVVSGINALNSINPPSIFITQDEMEIVLSPYTPANASRPAFRLALPSGKNYFSVAALPDNAPATLALFQQHAFAFVKDSKASWTYNENTADLVSSFTLETELMEGSETQAIQALYRHQYIHSSNVNTSYTYNSPRGPMHAMIGNQFSTSVKHLGLLPNLGWAGTYDSLYLYSMFDKLMTQTSFFWENYYYGESYEHGKKLGRYADLIPIARQVGHTAAYRALLDSVRTQLESWFSAAPSGTKNYKMFYYDSEWNTLAAYPTGYMAAGQLNDHHFHYGYFIKAAAMVARYVPGWANQYGPMVESLIKDVNNWDRSDTRFPYLRFFDPYAGHSWASGHANFVSGNNQESATEAINFATAVALWGVNTNNTTIRDLGIYLATNEIAATEQYWWNKDNACNPVSYTHKTSALVWGDKVEYRTWFPPGDPRHVHGINWLPITGASVFLGYDNTLVASNYNEVTGNEPILSTTPSPNTPLLSTGKDWRDLAAMYVALNDPSLAKNIEAQLIAEADMPYAGTMYPYAAFDGTSWQLTHHWIHTLDSVGKVASITADFATTNVFYKNNCKHYMIYNPPGNPGKMVTFSDGNSFWIYPDTLQVFYKCPDPLPVRLLNFEGKRKENDVLVFWNVQEEKDLREYVVERSVDGVHFFPIGTIEARHQSYYSKPDAEVPSRTLYYRLKMVDQDGTYSYSAVISLHPTGEFTLHPNPASHICYISVAGEDAEVEIYDALGRLVFQGNGDQEIHTDTLTPGIYVVRALSGGTSWESQKLVVEK